MGRTIPASIQAQFDANHSKLSRCVKVVLRDGTTYGFTDHDEDIVVDLDGEGDITYRPDRGVMTSNIDLALGLDSSTMEMVIPIVAPITRQRITGRAYNQADVWIFDVNWVDNAVIEFMRGWVGEAMVRNNRGIFEIRSLTDRFNQSVGRILSPRCTATFGDTQCGVPRIPVAAVVTGVTDSLTFAVDLAGTLSDGYFKYGFAEFLTGDLTGTWEFEVYDYVNSTGAVTLLAPMPGVPAIGDELNLMRGCSNMKSNPDDLTVPTCATYGNVVRFRGFDRVPGSDQYFRVPIPGEGSA